MLKSKTPNYSKTTVSILSRPQHVNFGGNVYGGFILQEADSVAYICAARHSGKYCVTASVDAVDFHQPVEIGNVLTFKALINFVHETSMEVGVRVEAENPKTKKKFHVATCYFTMVAVDEEFKPVKVPKLVLKNADDKRRFKEGKKRRELRLKRISKRNRNGRQQMEQ